MKSIYLAGGCFWGVEEYFNRIEGIRKTKVGYLNSRVENPSYELVCTGTTGAVEAVYLEYDEDVISLTEILDYLFKVIDPTVSNRQGPDIGSQYQTGIYFTNIKDKDVIEEFIQNKQKEYDKKIVTEVKELENFYLAEEYHQRYLKKNPGGYCHINLDS